MIAGLAYLLVSSMLRATSSALMVARTPCIAAQLGCTESQAQLIRRMSECASASWLCFACIKCTADRVLLGVPPDLLLPLRSEVSLLCMGYVLCLRVASLHNYRRY